MAHEMIHGGGSDCNTANRWFDKTMQIIICNDGTWGLCYEHSTSEGIAVVLLLERILNKINLMENKEEGVPQQLLPPPERLDWMISPEISHRMFLATKTVDKRIADLDFQVYRYKGYGKTFIKRCKVSPDVYIQLALQLAYYKWDSVRINYSNDRQIIVFEFVLQNLRLYCNDLWKRFNSSISSGNYYNSFAE